MRKHYLLRKQRKFQESNIDIMNDHLEFKKLIFNLWNRFPNGLIADEIVDKVIIMGAVRQRLVKAGFLYSEPYHRKGKDGLDYGLGPNGISLVIDWETQGSTKSSEAIAGYSFVIATFALGLQFMEKDFWLGIFVLIAGVFSGLGIVYFANFHNSNFARK